MKKRKVSEELVKKTVDTLDELESSVLGVKTGVTAGGIVDGSNFPVPTPDYGCPPPCTSDH